MTLEAKSELFNHWDFSIPGAMIGGAVITLLMLCCCWRQCRQSKDATYPMPTAPPGPLVINHTVEPARSRIFVQHCVQQTFDHEPHIEPPFCRIPAAKVQSLGICSPQVRSTPVCSCQKKLLVPELLMCEFVVLLNDLAICQFVEIKKLLVNRCLDFVIGADWVEKDQKLQ
jgi:hypothetical protein